MRKNAQSQNELQNEVHFASNEGPSAVAPRRIIYSKAGKYLKIFIYTVLLTLTGIVFDSCVGYVASEPTYIEHDRPHRPGDAYIWIDGGWRWDSRSHIYMERPGYWAVPRENRLFVSGHWQVTPHGKKWVDGHWQRQNGTQGRHDRHDR